MKTKVIWKENMKFEGVSGEQTLSLDAKSPLGRGEGLTPKELVALGMIGCTAMDVAALMKKHKQPVESFEVSTDIAMSAPGKHPAVFEKAEVVFDLKGNIDATKLVESVELSQTKYCGVTAMLVTSFPISYKVLLNEEEIGSGQAKF